MLSMRHDEPIYGEAFEDLFSVIVDLQYLPDSRGRVQITSHDLPEARVTPLVRALMRAEAEVLLERAEAGETYYGDGRGEQRQGEAFARVFRAVGLAEGKLHRDN